LFTNAVSTSGCTVSIGRMASEQRIRKGDGKRRSCPVSRYCSGIRLDGLRKAANNVRQNAGCFGHFPNPKQKQICVTAPSAPYAVSRLSTVYRGDRYTTLSLLEIKYGGDMFIRNVGRDVFEIHCVTNHRPMPFTVTAVSLILTWNYNFEISVVYWWYWLLIAVQIRIVGYIFEVMTSLQILKVCSLGNQREELSWLKRVAQYEARRYLSSDSNRITVEKTEPKTVPWRCIEQDDVAASCCTSLTIECH
jgi:hypothetical protein